MMVKRSSRWLHIGEWLLNLRWWFVAIGSLGIFAFEYVEYQPNLHGVSKSFFFEIIFYGVILPVSTGLALTKLAESRTELAWSLYYGDLERNLNTQLNNTHSYVELAETLLQFVKVIVPLAGMEIYKYEQGVQSYQLILRWSLNKEDVRFVSIPYFEIGSCDFPVEYPGVDEITLQPCSENKVDGHLEVPICYCIPFYFSKTLVAGARLYLPSGSVLTLEQNRLLKEVTPEIASTFKRIQLERMSQSEDTGSISAEQRRIARDVHDTLGHNLAYLRLRLDQISMEFDQTEANSLKKEVEDLRDVAKEAYDQMRNVLIMLSPDEDSNIDASLENLAIKIKQRANFELRFQSTGKPYRLPLPVQRNINYIFQEALTNIEKHANAKLVDAKLSWEDASLIIRVCDDGVGFDTDIQKDGHFGLLNMQERALECNAKLSISSKAGQGTQLELQVPYESKK